MFPDRSTLGEETDRCGLDQYAAVLVANDRSLQAVLIIISGGRTCPIGLRNADRQVGVSLRKRISIEFNAQGVATTDPQPRANLQLHVESAGVRVDRTTIRR